MERTDHDVDEFLAGLRSERAEFLRAVDAVIAEALGGLERRLWEGVFWGGTEQQIIGYGHIVQPRPRGAAVDWFLVGLAEQKRHLSIYVNASDGTDYLVRSWAERLGKVTASSAAITFASVDDLDLDQLRAMLTRARELTPHAT
jgi:hypothetical protein